MSSPPSTPLLLMTCMAEAGGAGHKFLRLAPCALMAVAAAGQLRFATQDMQLHQEELPGQASGR